MNRNLYHTLSQLNKLIGKTPGETSNKITLIGGQALIAWVHAFGIEDFSNQEYDFLASDDLDFIGNQLAITECAACWNGRVVLPTIDDSTPQTGQIVLVEQNEKGEAQVVDFLGAAYGIPAADVQNYSDRISIEGGGHYFVISPPICLMSRIKNITGYLRNAEEQMHLREVSRIKSAITITARYMEYLATQDISDGTTRRTKDAVRYLIKTLLVNKDTASVSVSHGINFDGIFPIAIRTVQSEIYDKSIIPALEKFNQAVAKKIRSNALRLQQKEQKKLRLQRKL